MHEIHDATAHRAVSMPHHRYLLQPKIGSEGYPGVLGFFIPMTWTKHEPQSDSVFHFQLPIGKKHVAICLCFP